MGLAMISQVSGADLLLQTQSGDVSQHVGRDSSPRKIGSRKIRLNCPSILRAASRSPADSGRAGCTGVRLKVRPRRERRVGGTESLDGQAVAEQQMVHGRQPGRRVLHAGGVGAADVAEERRAPRLVQRGPDRHPVAESIVDVEGVLAETVRGVPVAPAALVLDRLRQVPVVERQPRHDVVLEQFVDQPRVEVESGRVDRPAVGADPRPRRGEAIALHAERRP